MEPNISSWVQAFAGHVQSRHTVPGPESVARTGALQEHMHGGMKDQQMSFAIGLRPSTPSVLWNATLLTTVHSHCPTTCSVRRTSRQASDRKAT
ncbi:hypothetical protein CSPX01_12687 [Colletotrichum filicis]|nr:hypothetical protein CSPX01_12687 [Colletotrichum filicis]